MSTETNVMSTKPSVLETHPFAAIGLWTGLATAGLATLYSLLKSPETTLVTATEFVATAGLVSGGITGGLSILSALWFCRSPSVGERTGSNLSLDDLIANDDKLDETPGYLSYQIRKPLCIFAGALLGFIVASHVSSDGKAGAGLSPTPSGTPVLPQQYPQR